EAGEAVDKLRTHILEDPASSEDYRFNLTPPNYGVGGPVGGPGAEGWALRHPHEQTITAAEAQAITQNTTYTGPPMRLYRYGEDPDACQHGATYTGPARFIVGPYTTDTITITICLTCRQLTNVAQEAPL